MTAFNTIDDLDVAGKRVLVRVDLNVPMEEGQVTDATRIERIVPTIQVLRERSARVVLLSHLGRPKGQRRQEFSLRPLVAPLTAALDGAAVTFAEAISSSEARAASSVPTSSDNASSRRITIPRVTASRSPLRIARDTESIESAPAATSLLVAPSRMEYRLSLS